MYDRDFGTGKTLGKGKIPTVQWGFSVASKKKPKRKETKTLTAN